MNLNSEEIRNRLIKFLLKDRFGVRKTLLELFIRTKSYTSFEIYDYLIKQGFKVNYRGVSAMVGQMHSRLGILRIYLTQEHNIYSLKEDHWDIVSLVLTSQNSYEDKGKNT